VRTVIIKLILSISLTINVLLVVTLFLQPGISTYDVVAYPVVSERYYYTNSGEGGYSNNILWATIPPENDTGQITYINKTFLYGTFTWYGKHTGHPLTGWTIQGLSDLTSKKYIGFEHLCLDDAFRSITYNKTFPKQQGDSATYTYFENVQIDAWVKYSITWTSSYATFFINDVLVANHTSNIPTIPLYFHVHSAASPSFISPEEEIGSYAKDVLIT